MLFTLSAARKPALAYRQEAGEPKRASVPINAINSCKSCGTPDKANLIKLITLKSVSIYIQTRTHVNNNTYLYLLPQIILPMQVYITVAQLPYCDYPISKMRCPIMSVIFGKGLYLILKEMPPKRSTRFREAPYLITLSDYQTARNPRPPPVCLWQNQPTFKKEKGD